MGLINWFLKKNKTSKRGFEAAKSTRFTARWFGQKVDINETLKNDIIALRSRARDLALNNPYISKWLSMIAANVVGQNGIMIQPRSKNPDGSSDNYANKAIADLWWRWAKAGVCDASGIGSFADLERLAITSIARDGEIFVRLHRGYQNKYGFAISILEADFCPVNYNNADKNIIMGIERDQYGKPIAYYMHKKPPKSSNDLTDIERIEADAILHIFKRDRAAQARGASWCANVMNRINILAGYEEAELIAARIGASKMGFYTQSADALETTYNGGDGTDAAGNILTEVEPGILEQLPAGWDFKTADFDHPNTSYEAFVKSILRGIASGLNVSYSVLSGDLEGVNYSSIRQGVLEERDQWRVLQSWFADQFHQKIFEAWLDLQLLQKNLNLPYIKFDKFCDVVWLGRGWQWVDPLKDTNSAIAAIGAGLKTGSQVASEGGLDIEEIYEQLAAEKSLREKHGITIENDLITEKGGDD
ncbi:MAG: phage portal protein [Helicobacteraceae bacterium]|nr:phage portal protein [Helicobacteraceae bacterium]